MLNVDEVAALYYDEVVDECILVLKSGHSINIMHKEYNAILTQLSKLDKFISMYEGA